MNIALVNLHITVYTRIYARERMRVVALVVCIRRRSARAAFSPGSRLNLSGLFILDHSSTSHHARAFRQCCIARLYAVRPDS